LASVRTGAGSPDTLVRDYRLTRDAATCEALVQRCQGLVRAIASEFRSPGLADDLVQVGFVGLLNAIEHFDPDRGTPFVLFARHFVRGEIRHYLRDHRSLVRRPRWLERLNGRIEDAVDAHVNQCGRYPGLGDLATRLNLDVESLTEILKTRDVVRTLSLDVEDDEGQPSIDLDRSTDLSGVHNDDGARPMAHWLSATLEDRMILIDALEALNPLQRSVIFFLFFTDLTQAEAAQRVGVSQKHVSRVLASALHRLRQLLTDQPVPVS
jgi:RNA polymerase sigma-B factor